MVGAKLLNNFTTETENFYFSLFLTAQDPIVAPGSDFWLLFILIAEVFAKKRQTSKSHTESKMVITFGEINITRNLSGIFFSSSPFCFCLQVVQHLKHRTSPVTCSLRRSSLQQQQQHSCTRIDVSPVYMTPAPRREGPENNEDRDNWGEHWGELVLEHGQPGTEWVNEPEISAKIIKIFRIFFRFQLKKSSLSLSHGQTEEKPQNKIVWENSRHFADHHWLPCEMTSEERQQKFHTDTSSVWTVCARLASQNVGCFHRLQNKVSAPSCSYLLPWKGDTLFNHKWRAPKWPSPLG